MARVFGVGRTFKKGKGGIPARIEDADLIKDSMVQILITSMGERVMRPGFGSQVSGLVFETQSGILSSKVKHEVIRVLQKFEPRIKVISVTTTAEDTAMMVDIVYNVLGVEDKVSIPFGGAAQ